MLTTFSLIDAGKETLFQYNMDLVKDIPADFEVGDLVIVYYAKKNYANSVFSVREVRTEDSIVLAKQFEMSEGIELSDNLRKNISDCLICRLSEEQYREILDNLTEKLIEVVRRMGGYISSEKRAVSDV